jgi:pyruvate-ferredoxin/flavodoxin oxidoreductase
MKREQWSDDTVLFHKYLELSAEDREGKVPFIYARDKEEHLGRLRVSQEMVELAEERLDLWDELRELAGVKVPERVQHQLAKPLERRYREQLAKLEKEYESKLAELKANYPVEITRRIAEALVGGGLAGFGGGAASPAAASPAAASPAASAPAVLATPAAPVAPEVTADAPVTATPVSTEAAVAEAAVAEVAEEEDEGGFEPYIDTELCTSCNECTNLNPKMFAYNDDKKAYIKDPRAGTFQQLVLAAERCTARIIHPGTPLDPDEEDLEKWVKRAEAFN